ncbi:Uncharacterised protein g6275 [Pycnogonum litorale]
MSILRLATAIIAIGNVVASVTDNSVFTDSGETRNKSVADDDDDYDSLQPNDDRIARIFGDITEEDVGTIIVALGAVMLLIVVLPAVLVVPAAIIGMLLNQTGLLNGLGMMNMGMMPSLTGVNPIMATNAPIPVNTGRRKRDVHESLPNGIERATNDVREGIRNFR